MVRQLGRGDRHPAFPCDPYRRLEGRRQAFVRLDRAEGQVSATIDRIVEDRRQSAVGRPTCLGWRPLVQRRGQQRVGEARDVVVGVDHVHGVRPLERVRLDAQGVKEPDGQPAVRRDEQQCPPSRCVEGVESYGQQPLQARRHDQRSRQVAHRVTRLGIGQLECVVGVATRHLVEPEEGRPWEHHPEPVAEQLLDRAHAQRADRQPGDIGLPDHGLDTGRLPRRVDAPREQELHRQTQRAPQGEREGGSRGRVHPLVVVDREEQRSAIGQRGQDGGDGDAERPRFDRTLRLRAQERRLERATSRGGQRGKRGIVDRSEQVAEDDIGQRPLGLRRARRQDTERPCTRRGDRGLPERGLSDPRLPLEDQRGDPIDRPVEPGVDRVELRLAPDDLACHQCRRIRIVSKNRSPGTSVSVGVTVNPETYGLTSKGCSLNRSGRNAASSMSSRWASL